MRPEAVEPGTFVILDDEAIGYFIKRIDEKALIQVPSEGLRTVVFDNLEPSGLGGLIEVVMNGGTNGSEGENIP